MNSTHGQDTACGPQFSYPWYRKWQTGNHRHIAWRLGICGRVLFPLYVTQWMTGVAPSSQLELCFQVDNSALKSHLYALLYKLQHYM
jgi:hypothetical protein